MEARSIFDYIGSRYPSFLFYILSQEYLFANRFICSLPNFVELHKWFRGCHTYGDEKSEQQGAFTECLILNTALIKHSLFGLHHVKSESSIHLLQLSVSLPIFERSEQKLREQYSYSWRGCFEHIFILGLGPTVSVYPKNDALWLTFQLCGTDNI